MRRSLLVLYSACTLAADDPTAEPCAVYRTHSLCHAHDVPDWWVDRARPNRLALTPGARCSLLGATWHRSADGRGKRPIPPI
eukprot:1936270-Prymnesium_polylepis.1